MLGAIGLTLLGGSTTVNWTSSFRTPSATLKYWRERFGLNELTDEHMAGWFERAEKLLVEHVLVSRTRLHAALAATPPRT